MILAPALGGVAGLIGGFWDMMTIERDLRALRADRRVGLVPFVAPRTAGLALAGTF